MHFFIESHQYIECSTRLQLIVAFILQYDSCCFYWQTRQFYIINVFYFDNLDIDSNNQNNIFQWRTVNKSVFYNIHVEVKFTFIKFTQIRNLSNETFIGAVVAIHYHHKSIWFQFVFAGMSLFVICNYAGEKES